MLEDTEESRERLRAYSPEQLAVAVVDVEPRRRAEMLELAERVEQIVPCLPEAEFLSTVRSTGVADAGWLVEFATAEQRVAAVDIDCWKGAHFAPSRLFEWIDAMIEAGPETLVAAFDELDPEVWILAMKEMADFYVIGEGGGDDIPGDMTVDGFVFYEPRYGDHEDRLRDILMTAVSESPSHYWGFVYGAMLESKSECEEYAAQWQAGRLADLGFMDREQAMRAYKPLVVDRVPVVEDVSPHESSALVVGIRVPQRLAGTFVGSVLMELSPEKASLVLGAVLGVANTIAMADRLPLGEPETVEASLRKALRGIDRGLAELATARDLPPSLVLETIPALDLFRVGITFDDELRPAGTLDDVDAQEASEDWNVATEWLEDEEWMVVDDDSTTPPSTRRSAPG